MQEKNFYIYAHSSYPYGNIFYIGMADSRCYSFKYARAYNFTIKGRSKSWIAEFRKLKGISAMIIEEHSSIEECKKREIYFIKLYGKRADGSGCLVNIANGGDNNTSKIPCKVLQYNLEGDFIKEWASVTDISKTREISEKSIYQCLSKNKSLSNAFGSMWVWYSDKYSKKILPYRNLRTEKRRVVYAFSKHGRLKFNSITEGANKTKSDTSSIFKCLNGKRKSCGGFYWSCDPAWAKKNKWSL